MNLVLLWLIGLLLAHGTSGLFTDNELTALLSLKQLFNTALIVFIDGKNTTFSIIKELKKLSNLNLISMVISPEQLEKILVDEDRFFDRSVIFATKENLHIKKYVGMVLPATNIFQVGNRVSAVWTLFADPLDVDFCGEPVPLNSQVFQIKSNENRTSVFQLYHPEGLGKTMAKDFGFFPIGKPNVLPDYNTYYWDKLTLRDKTVKIGVPGADNLCRTFSKDYVYDMLDCFHINLVNIIAKKLNFTESFVEYIGEEYNFVLPNGSYVGFSKMIIDGQVDISSPSFVISKKRMVNFDFVWPTFSLKTMMYLNKDDVDASLPMGIPIAPDVWAALFLWMIITGVTLYASDRIGNNKEEPAHGSLIHSILKVMQLICNQALAEVPLSWSSRIIQISTIFGAFLFLNFYSATVVSYLTTEEANLPFQNLEGFLESGKYKTAASPYGFASYYIRNELALEHYNISQYFVLQENLPKNTEEGVKELCTNKRMTYLDFKGNILNVGKFYCELIEIPQPIIIQNFGFALKKNSPYTKYIQPIIFRLRETGILARMQHNLTKLQSTKSIQIPIEYSKVGISKILFMFVILCIGLVLAMMRLIFESAGLMNKFERKTAS